MTKCRPFWFKGLSRDTQATIRDLEQMAKMVGHTFVAEREKAEMFDRAHGENVPEKSR